MAATAPAVSQTALEAAQSRFDAASAAHLKASHRHEGLSDQRVMQAKKVAQAEAEHRRLLRGANSGEGSDPRPAKVELQTQTDILNDLDDLLRESADELTPLAQRATVAGLTLSLRRQEDELEDLLKREVEAANFARESLQKSDEARRALNSINFEIGKARKLREAIEAELREASSNG